MVSQFKALIFFTALLVLSGSTFADSPKSLAKPDSHSVQVSGKITLYRVQVEGMHMGEGKNAVDAEVFVTLDTSPNNVYSLQVHNDSPTSNILLADTLRDAYLTNQSVTLYHQIPIKQDNYLKILMVQMGR